MQKIKNLYNNFFNNFLLIFLTLFGIISSLAYSFKELQIGTTGGLVFRIILASLFVIAIIPGLFFKNQRIPKILFILCCIYIVSNAVVIFVSPVIYNINISLLTQFAGIAQSFINIGCIYLFYYLINSFKLSQKQNNFVFLIIISFVSFLCLFTYIFQFQDIINTFRPVSDCKYCGWNADVTSIYYIKTVYGFMLLIGSIVSLFYSILKKKYLYLFLTLFFILNMFISRSKTSILTLLILVLIIAIYFLIKYRKQLIKRWYFIAIGLIVMVVLIMLTTFKVGPFFEKLNYFISNTIIGDGVVVLKDRFYRWGKVFTTINNPLNVIFGLGERVNNPILSNINSVSATDSLYVYLYSTGGIFIFTIYLPIFITLFKKCLKNKCKFSLIIFSCILINFFFELNSIIGTAYNQILPLIMLIFIYKIEYEVNTSKYL